MWRLGKLFHKKNNKKSIKKESKEPKKFQNEKYSKSDSEYPSEGKREKIKYRSKSEKLMKISQTEYQDMKIQGEKFLF